MASGEDDPSNGLVLKEVYIPEEVLVLILSNLDAKTLVNCRRVCKHWREIASGPAWHSKVSGEVRGMDLSFFRHHKLSWEDYFWISHKKPFGRNLIQNPCGKEKFKHWNVNHGGDGWRIEVAPQGCDAFPKKFPSCFVTSYHHCNAEQMIDLYKEGLTKAAMDEINPEITISEWYAGRWDCGFQYKIAVSLLNSEWEVIKSFNFDHKETDANDRVTWKNVTHTFRDYGKGVQFVMFYHSGKDTQFWAGHYGAKMTGSEVIVSLP